MNVYGFYKRVHTIVFGKEYESTWIASNRERLLGKISKVVPFASGQKFLDAGCSSGFYTSSLSKSGYAVGVDVTASSWWKKMTQSSRNNIFVKCDARKLPFSKKSFDLVFAKDLFHHLPHRDVVTTINELKKVSGGIIVIVEGTRYTPIGSLVVKYQRHEHFSTHQFQKLMGSSAHFFGVEAYPFYPIWDSLNPLAILWNFCFGALLLLINRFPRVIIFLFKVMDLIEKVICPSTNVAILY